MTRNVEMLVRAARALGDLRDEVVFVGGAVVDLFITDPAAPHPRFTEDVDVVVEVTTHGAWSRLGERLRSLGFREDQREGAPICRWRFGDLAMDVMPVLERVLGFSNRWYRMPRGCDLSPLPRHPNESGVEHDGAGHVDLGEFGSTVGGNSSTAAIHFNVPSR